MRSALALLLVLVLGLAVAFTGCGETCSSENTRGLGPRDCSSSADSGQTTGSTGTGTSSGSGTGGATGSGQLYVSQANAILRFAGASALDGDVAPAAVIEGADTRLSSPGFLFLDQSNDRLYVANTGGNNLLVYDQASTLNGNIPPTRVLEGPNTTLSGPVHAVLDSTRDALYVSNPGRGALLAFSNASGIQGDVAPVRTVTGTDTRLSSNGMLRLDGDRLYVANTGGSSVLVFDPASTANGSPFPTRRLEGRNTRLSSPGAVELDVANNLYAANPTALLRFNPADTVDADVAPAAVVEGSDTGLSGVGQILIDGSGNLYLANTGASNVLVFNSIVNASGNPFPSRRLSGANTRLNGPTGIALDPSR
ncbi:MAG: hypothetical protein AB1758_08615 [Candidatus Eremiobacterota bacterium]